MSKNLPDFHVLTGGPGSGKSSLVAALADEGFHHVPEAGRAIIKEQVAQGGSALPWKNRDAFASLMLDWDMRSYRSAKALHGPVFFDRGIVDIIGYRRLCGLPVSDHLIRTVEGFRYNRRVFIAPHWPEIFTQDRERKQTALEAKQTVDAMVEAYSSFGYDLVPIPLVSVAERVRFIRENMS